MATRKKILVLTDWFEPGYKAGGPIRSVSNLVHQLGNDFDFYVLTSNSDFGDAEPYSGIPQEKWLAQEGFHVKYVPVEWMSSPNLLMEIDQLGVELVYMNSLFSKHFTLTPLLALKKWKGKKVLAPRGMLGASSLQVKSMKKKMFLTMAKGFRLFSTVHWHATNPQEKKEIERTFSKATVSVAANLGRMPSNGSALKKKKAVGTLDLVFFARISPIKNLDYCLQVLQKTEPVGKIIFHVIGPIEDKLYWRSCLDQELPKHVSLHYHGEMNPQELAAQLPAFDLLFLPTKNENFGHSIVEAWSHGLPVLISDRTPWHGLKKARVGAEFPLHNEEAFVTTIDQYVSMNDEEYQALSQQAVKHAQSIIHNPESLDNYRKMFSEA